jgi:hypothetical protein
MSETNNDITSGLTNDITNGITNIIDSSKENLGSIFNTDSKENMSTKTTEIFDILTKTKDHIANLNSDLTTIYSAILKLKNICKLNENNFASKNEKMEESIQEVNNEKQRIELEMNEIIQSKTLSIDELHSKLVEIKTEQDKLNSDNEKLINELQNEILRCAKEKGDIFDELTKIDKQIEVQTIGNDSWYSKLTDVLKLPPKSVGGFNWRTAAESKKLMSSKSSNKFLREKDNNSKKLRKSSRTSQNMKSKKKKKGIFRNLGLFRKNKK